MDDDRNIANIAPDTPPDSAAIEDISTRQPRRRFVGRGQRTAGTTQAASVNGSSNALADAKAPRAPRILNQIPREILEDPELLAAIGYLPSNYNFEIQKTVHRVRSSGATNIALQFPEGLLMFAPLISDILTRFCPGTDTLIMGDVTYGACCIDDYTARALGCDLLVHYGHSCLVPLDQTGGIKTLYVFVTIGIDVEHLIRTVESNFQPGKKIALVGTIQFNTTLHTMSPRLRSMGYEIILPRSAPLSAGEILGCTAPTLTARDHKTEGKEVLAGSDADMILYVGDGRFHLESILIASPTLRAHTYRYDPYSRRLTLETYEHEEMHSLRRHAIQTARKTMALARSRSKPVAPLSASDNQEPVTWGIILGTLGRQGNPHTVDLIIAHLTHLGIPYITLLLSEIQPAKISLMSRDVAVWIQVACPRLSIDWGYAFVRPLLSPYEAMVALKLHDGGAWLDDETTETTSGTQSEVPVYDMNFYAAKGLGRTRAEDVPTLHTGTGLEVEVH